MSIHFHQNLFLGTSDCKSVFSGDSDLNNDQLDFGDPTKYIYNELSDR